MSNANNPFNWKAGPQTNQPESTEQPLLPAQTPYPDESANSLTEEKSEQIESDFSVGIRRFHDVRAMKIWEVLAISLGCLPYRNTLRRRSANDAEFRKAYLNRKRFLKRRLTAAPKDGLILHLTDYPGAMPDAQLENQYVDLCSAFKVLRSKYSDLPSEVATLEVSATAVPLPPGSYDDSDDVTAQPDSQSGKPRRDQTASVASKLNKNLQKLVVALTQLHYGTVTASNAGQIARQIAKEMVEANLEDGLGATAIETQLRHARRAIEG